MHVAFMQRKLHAAVAMHYAEAIEELGKPARHDAHGLLIQTCCAKLAAAAAAFDWLGPDLRKILPRLAAVMMPLLLVHSLLYLFV